MSHCDTGSSTTAVALPAVPVLDAPAPRSVFVLLLPLVMMAGTVGFLVIGGGGTTSLLMGGLMVASLIGMMASGGGRGTKPAAAVAADRDRFLRRLGRARSELAGRESALREAAHRRHPAPGVRRSAVPVGAGAASTVRVGVGMVPVVVHAEWPEDDPDAQPEPFAELARRWFERSHATTAAMPLTVDLAPGRPWVLIGADAADLARAMVVQWARSSAPTRGHLVLLAPDDVTGWDWLKWLPHHGAFGTDGPRRTADALVARQWISRFGAQDPRCAVLLVCVLQSRRVLDMVCAGPAPGHPPLVLALPGVRSEEHHAERALSVVDGALHRVDHGRLVPWGTADRLGEAAARALARQLAAAPDRAGGAVAARGVPSGLPELLGLTVPGDLRPEVQQVRTASGDRLRVPIGVDSAGTPVHLDLKEAAHGGVGPHGLLVGATGSGKSELLRTVVLALAATHSSQDLNLVLIDFKGGAGFLALQRLPHVAAVITNLADQSVLVARMRDALTGELQRRQELLRRAGNVASAVEYERARTRDPRLRPLPALVVVCDEFTELLVQHPDLAETFVTLGRLGRSLGVHLLMSSQRLEEGRMRGLDAHLSYRIALKTFSAADSRAVLDLDVAYRLPPTPGVGYLKTGAGEPVAFTAAYVSGAAPAAAPAAGEGARGAADESVRLFTARRRSDRPEPVVQQRITPAIDNGSPTLSELWIDRLEPHGPPAHPLWLPPLGVAPVLDELVRTVPPPPESARWRIPVGIVDRPFEQRHDLLWADFSGSTGHALVVGGARSGKSTVLAVLVLALASAHPPAEVHCYIIDLGGGTAAALAAVPQVGGVARRDEPERVRRTVAQLTAELAAREVAPATDGDAVRAEVFLLIDGWSAFRAEFEDLEPAVVTLVHRGLAVGIHVVLTASRWAEIRPALKDLMGTRFELRLGDPAESEVDRRRATEVPDRSPGRGLTREGFHFLSATPGPVTTPGSLVRAVADRRARWPGPGAPPVRMLPVLIAADTVLRQAVGHPPGTVPLGVGESALQVVTTDFDADPHLIVWGDSGSGRTSFLRTLASTIAARRTPTDARFLVVDHRRTLLGALPEAHLAGHAASAASTAGLVAEAVQLLSARLPTGDVSAADLRARSWWTGPELFVLVDDHEMVAADPVDPLAPLIGLLPQARDIGLHLVICRRASGGARALWNPVLQQLRELGSPGLILSGPPDEGPLLGTRRPSAQPPGRGFWVTRTATELVQLALADH